MEAIYSVLTAYTFGAALSILLFKGSKAMKWETDRTEKPNPVQKLIRTGPFYLAVDESETPGDKQWQYVTISFGEFTSRSLDECLKQWPRDVIALARAALDKFEASLEETNEAGIQERDVDSGVTPA